jgi:hypothetical protein
MSFSYYVLVDLILLQFLVVGFGCPFFCIIHHEVPPELLANFADDA